MARIADLPEEVVALIGLRVDKRTIKAAIRTCRHLTIPSSTYSGDSLLWLQGRVTFCSKRPSVWLHFPSKQPGEHHSSTDKDQDGYHPAFFSLNSHVKDLVFKDIEPASSTALWETIYTSLHDPKRLEVYSSGLAKLNALDSFLRACTRFEEVHLSIFEFAHCDTLLELSFPQLKRITLKIQYPYLHTSIGFEGSLSWLIRCPNLNTLDWEIYGYEGFTTDRLIRVFTDKTWPRLESFSWTRGSVSDDVSADILRALPPLKVYRTKNKPFKDLSFSRLQVYHFGTLRSLNIRGCTSFSGQMTLSVLSECVHLEEFQAYYIRAGDLRSKDPNSRNWACTGLKLLRMYIASDPNDPEADELVFEQLSRLHRLEELQTKKINIHNLPMELRNPLEQQRSIQLRLDSGFAHLATLKRLKIFKFESTYQRMGSEEVAWILQNWTTIQEITGLFCEDDTVQKALGKVLEDAEIDHHAEGFGFDFFMD
ncbi:hypothetical protein BGX23_006351 [Mortierella sp. AD031]|nr:hypothetical protein BGX23_006351 [Mortierella sp. AD031]